MAPTTTTNDFHVTPFDGCDGCIHKVKMALRKFDDLKLIKTDHENGIFTISTIAHPEAIRAALQQEFRKKSINLLPKKEPTNFTVEQSHSCVESREGNVDFKGMTEMLMTLPQAERIQSVELRQDVLRVDYYQKQSIISKAAAHVEDVSFVPPPRGMEPSAPPLPYTNEGYAYGYPARSYGYSATSKDDYAICGCTIV